MNIPTFHFSKSISTDANRIAENIARPHEQKMSLCAFADCHENPKCSTYIILRIFLDFEKRLNAVQELMSF